MQNRSLCTYKAPGGEQDIVLGSGDGGSECIEGVMSIDEPVAVDVVLWMKPCMAQYWMCFRCLSPNSGFKDLRNKNVPNNEDNQQCGHSLLAKIKNFLKWPFSHHTVSD
jgi:hypothetical protein